MKPGYDLIVVGAGIVGLGMALAGVRKGKRVAVVERNARAVGASIRNFGFVTVSGQRAGAHWERARRTRDIWAEIAGPAGIEVLHRGAVMPAYRPEAEDVIDAFLATPMGEGCRRIGIDEAVAEIPVLCREGMRAALYSPHELRVESAQALPQLAAWLEQGLGVDFHWSTAVRAVDGGRVETNRGVLEAAATIVCPGDDFTTLFAERIAPHGLSVCTLQMLRLMPERPVRFGAAVMSDLSLGRYEGFADLPQGRILSAVLDRDLPEVRSLGIHVIAVQSADGSLVVGDSHLYGDAPEPFSQERIDALILEEFGRFLAMPGYRVERRWSGTYASSKKSSVLVDKPAENVRLAMVTGGTGASTGFALGEQVVAELFG